MKKYIYGTLLLALVTSVAIFFFRPPETNRPPQTNLSITFRFPEGYAFTEGAPFLLTWQTETPEGKLSVPVPEERFNPFASPYLLAFSPEPGSAAVVLNARLYYCHTASRMCFQGDFKARVPLIAGSMAPLYHLWDITPERPLPEKTAPRS